MCQVSLTLPAEQLATNDPSSKFRRKLYHKANARQRGAGSAPTEDIDPRPDPAGGAHHQRLCAEVEGAGRGIVAPSHVGRSPDCTGFIRFGQTIPTVTKGLLESSLHLNLYVVRSMLFRKSQTHAHDPGGLKIDPIRKCHLCPHGLSPHVTGLPGSASIYDPAHDRTRCQ